MINQIMDAIQPYIIPAFISVVTLIVSFIVGVMAILQKKLNVWIDAHTTDVQRATLHKFASEAYSLIEANFKASGGEAKLQIAYEYVAKRVKDYGIDVSAESIKAAIEKAVQDAKVKNEIVK